MLKLTIETDESIVGELGKVFLLKLDSKRADKEALYREVRALLAQLALIVLQNKPTEEEDKE